MKTSYSRRMVQRFIFIPSGLECWRRKIARRDCTHLRRGDFVGALLAIIPFSRSASTVAIATNERSVVAVSTRRSCLDFPAPAKDQIDNSTEDGPGYGES